MKKDAFCNLWYFTNQGLKAAEKSAAFQEDLNYVAVCRDDNDGQVLVVSVLKSSLVRFCCLFWHNWTATSLQIFQNLCNRNRNWY